MNEIELQQEFHTVIKDPNGKITSKSIEVCKMDGTPKYSEYWTYNEKGEVVEYVKNEFDEHGKIIKLER